MCPGPTPPAKARGSAIYTDDMKLPGMLHGRILRSPFAHALIKHIDTSKAASLPGVKCVITAEDTPKIKYGNWRLFPETQDEYPLAVDKVRFIGDEVAAVAAIDKDTAEEALELIKVEYEELPAVFDVDSAMQPGAPIIHDYCPTNVSVNRKIEYGDVEKGFAESDYVREDTFTFTPVIHAYLEPCSALAQVDLDGRITLWTSTQVPYIVQCLLASTLGMRENDVRVIKPFIGGGFGGKMELRTWEFCAALMAKKTGRPVKFTLSREEEFLAGRRRHPMKIHSKVGFKKDGTLVAKDLKIQSGRRGVQCHGTHGHVLVRQLRGHALPLSQLPISRATRVYEQAAGQRNARFRRSSIALRHGNPDEYGRRGSGDRSRSISGSRTPR